MSNEYTNTSPQSFSKGNQDESKWKQLVRGLTTICALLVGCLGAILVFYPWCAGIRPDNKPLRWILLLATLALIIYIVTKARAWIIRRKAIIVDASMVGLFSFIAVSYIVFALCWTF